MNILRGKLDYSIVVAVGFVVVLSLIHIAKIDVYASNEESIPMYRMYNPNSGEHFYTSNSNEKLNLQIAGWDYEGTGWKAPVLSDTPVYRLYNPNTGDHHYTINAEEKEILVNNIGWRYEGIGWYSYDKKTVTMFRLYNPNSSGAGSHHYTSSVSEKRDLINAGWIDEGIGWYAIEEGMPEVPKYRLLKEYILTNGIIDTRTDGYYYIRESQGETSFLIEYSPQHDIFILECEVEAGWDRGRQFKNNIIVSINGSIKGDAHVVLVYYNREGGQGSFNVPTYNNNTDITVYEEYEKTHPSNQSHQDMANELIRKGFVGWDTMLKERLGFGINELGFYSYN